MLMSLEVTYENNFHGVMFTYHHELSGMETIAANNALYASPNADKLRYAIIDLRDIDTVDITTEQMSILAQQDNEEAAKASGQKLAIVVDNDLIHGVSSFYSLYVNSSIIEARTFNTMEEARSWIDGLFNNKKWYKTSAVKKLLA